MILLNFVTGKMETYDMVAKEKIDLLKKKMPYAMKLLRGVRCRIEIIYKMKYGL